MKSKLSGRNLSVFALAASLLAASLAPAGALAAAPQRNAAARPAPQRPAPTPSQAAAPLAEAAPLSLTVTRRGCARGVCAACGFAAVRCGAAAGAGVASAPAQRVAASA